MKRIVMYLFLSLYTAVSFAQTEAFEAKPEHIEKKADSLTKVYSAKLGMTPKQDLLFKKGLEDYLVLREEIEGKFTGKAKLEELTRVYVDESAAMSEILTEYQFELYERIKPAIQPLDQVEKN